MDTWPTASATAQRSHRRLCCGTRCCRTATASSPAQCSPRRLCDTPLCPATCQEHNKQLCCLLRPLFSQVRVQEPERRRVPVTSQAHLKTMAAAQIGMHVPGPFTSSSRGRRLRTTRAAVSRARSVVNTEVTYDWPTSLLRGMTSTTAGAASCICSNRSLVSSIVHAMVADVEYSSTPKFLRHDLMQRKHACVWLSAGPLAGAGCTERSELLAFAAPIWSVAAMTNVRGA